MVCYSTKHKTECPVLPQLMIITEEKSKKPLVHKMPKKPILLRRAEQLSSVKLMMLTDHDSFTQQMMEE